jgi:hypothetical protein
MGAALEPSGFSPGVSQSELRELEGGFFYLCAQVRLSYDDAKKEIGQAPEPDALQDALLKIYKIGEVSVKVSLNLSAW